MESNKQQILELEKKKVKQILDFIRTNQLKDNSIEYDKFKEMIRELFEIDISLHEQNSYNFTTVRLDFINNKNSIALGTFKDGYTPQNKEIQHIITINEGNVAFEHLKSDDIKLKEYACSEIIKVLFHEISHYKKLDLVYNNESNDRSLKFAKENIMINSINIREFYQNNHDSFFAENDAKMEANNKLSFLCEKEKQDNLDYISTYFFSTLEVQDKNKVKKKEVPRDDYVNYYIDTILYKDALNKYYLNRYPILQKEYDMNGIKKSLSSLIDNYFKEIDNINNMDLDINKKNIKIRNIKRMYFDIILRRLIPLRKENEINDDEINSLDEKTISLLEEIKNELLRLKKINLGLLDKIHIKKKIYDSDLNYINKNKKTKYHINNISYIYDIDEYIELFDLRQIKNNNELTDIEKDKALNFINNYFFKRLPKNGYFILKNGIKLSSIDFYNKYIIPNIKELYDLDLNGYIKYLKKIVISENECDNIINQEKVDRYYLNKIGIIDNFIKRIENSKLKEI